MDPELNDIPVSPAISPLTLEYTGERMVPEAADPGSLWDHIFRYHFALRYVRNRDVLDVACGEGYGTAAIKKFGARSVIGVDIDEKTCCHARQKYGIDARVGDAARLPFSDASFDTIISFETIEHVADVAKFVDECDRVLRPGGSLVVSTPNVEVYNAGNSGPNPYHCSEMSEEQFISQLRRKFNHLRMYSQHIVWARSWSLRSLAADWSRLSKIRGLYHGSAPYAGCMIIDLPNNMPRRPSGRDSSP